MKLSLYGKFVFFTIGAMLISFILAFLTVNTYYHQYLKEKNDEKNMSVAKHIADFIESHPNVKPSDFLETEAQSGYKIFLVNQQGEKQFFGEEFREENLSHDAISSVINGDVYHGMRDLPKETFVTGFFSDELANSVGVPVQIDGESFAIFLRPNIKFLFNEIHYLLGGLFIGMAIISVMFMLYVARKLVKPISKLTTATEKIGAEQFSVDLPVNRGDEIGLLAKSFQQMANQLQESDRLRKQFINDVSHDFQTPLQNIQGYAALIEDEKTSEAKKIQYGAIIQTETARLSTLTKQLLLLTSLDNLSTRLEKEAVRVDTQLWKTIQGFRWRMEEKDISVSAEIDEAIVFGNEGFLEKVWENLISNAIKYTETNGLIEIELVENEYNIIVTVKDSGIGMKKDELPHIFDRFYRADHSRHAKVEGTGLGLAIVDQVIKLHHGEIHVDSAPGKGSTFTIRLPKSHSF